MAGTISAPTSPNPSAALQNKSDLRTALSAARSTYGFTNPINGLAAGEPDQDALAPRCKIGPNARVWGGTTRALHRALPYPTVQAACRTRRVGGRCGTYGAYGRRGALSSAINARQLGVGQRRMVFLAALGGASGPLGFGGRR